MKSDVAPEQRDTSAHKHQRGSYEHQQPPGPPSAQQSHPVVLLTLQPTHVPTTRCEPYPPHHVESSLLRETSNARRSVVVVLLWLLQALLSCPCTSTPHEYELYAHVAGRLEVKLPPTPPPPASTTHQKCASHTKKTPIARNHGVWMSNGFPSLIRAIHLRCTRPDQQHH